MKLLLVLTTLFSTTLSLPAPAIPIAAPLIQIIPSIAPSSQIPSSSSIPTPTLSPTSILPPSADAPLPTEKPELKARQTIIGGGGGSTITGWGGPGWGNPGGGETLTFTDGGGDVFTFTLPPLSVTLGGWP